MTDKEALQLVRSLLVPAHYCAAILISQNEDKFSSRFIQSSKVVELVKKLEDYFIEQDENKHIREKKLKQIEIKF